MKTLLRRAAWALPMLLCAVPAFADDAPPKLDSGDTAWMLSSTALVLLMTVPASPCSMPAWCARRTCSPP